MSENNGITPEELQQLWDQSINDSEERRAASLDFELAMETAIGTEPSKDLIEMVSGVADRISQMSPEELAAAEEDAKRNSPLAKFMR